jgi:glutathione-regulated potassium-efflux system ancillary protein KefG
VTSSPKRRRILILFAHPALQKSRVNVRLAEAVRGLEDVTFHDLYEAYPLLDIDVPREQELAEGHEVLVMQHPFYWYSTPALLKQWQDLVLEHGWAYGSEGRALRGKILLSALSAGGSEEVYCAEGQNRFTIRQLLAPIEATARLCGMFYPPPFVVHGTHGLGAAEVARHASDYRRVIVALRDGTIDLEAARGRARLNRRLDELLRD